MQTQPVLKIEPILETSVERVFDNHSIPTSYRVEVKRPDSTVQIFDDVRRYTNQVVYDDAVTGNIGMSIVSSPNRRPIVIRYPCHYIGEGGVLCSLKQFQMLKFSSDEVRSYALNHRLFENDWKICVILNETETDIVAYVTSRAEWDRGEIAAIRGFELQVFLPIPNERGIAVRLMEHLVAPPIWQWMKDCVAIIRRKKNVS